MGEDRVNELLRRATREPKSVLDEEAKYLDFMEWVTGKSTRVRPAFAGEEAGQVACTTPENVGELVRRGSNQPSGVGRRPGTCGRIAPT